MAKKEPGSIDYELFREIVREEAAIATREMPTEIISRVAKEASKEAVTDVLLTMGVDATNPIEMQKIMAYAKECKDNGPRIKEAVEWAHDQKANGKIFKSSFIAEAAKHSATALIAIIVVWIGMKK